MTAERPGIAAAVRRFGVNVLVQLEQLLAAWQQQVRLQRLSLAGPPAEDSGACSPNEANVPPPFWSKMVARHRPEFIRSAGGNQPVSGQQAVAMPLRAAVGQQPGNRKEAPRGVSLQNPGIRGEGNMQQQAGEPPVEEAWQATSQGQAGNRHETISPAAAVTLRAASGPVFSTADGRRTLRGMNPVRLGRGDRIAREAGSGDGFFVPISGESSGREPPVKKHNGSSPGGAAAMTAAETAVANASGQRSSRDAGHPPAPATVSTITGKGLQSAGRLKVAGIPGAIAGMPAAPDLQAPFAMGSMADQSCGHETSAGRDTRSRAGQDKQPGVMPSPAFIRQQAMQQSPPPATSCPWPALPRDVWDELDNDGSRPVVAPGKERR